MIGNYQEARFKLTNTQLYKSKSAEKNKTETMLKSNEKTLKMNNYHMNYY